MDAKDETIEKHHIDIRGVESFPREALCVLRVDKQKWEGSQRMIWEGERRGGRDLNTQVESKTCNWLFIII